MKQYRLDLLLITGLVISSASYALPSNTLQTPAAQKIITQLELQKEYQYQPPVCVMSRLKKTNQEKLNILIDLRNKITTVSTNEKLIKKINNAIAKQQSLLALQDPSPNSEMNFLDLKLVDAINMLLGVPRAAQQTSKILMHMKELALTAANGTNGSDVLRQMNYEYQGAKQVIRFIQSVDLLNGEKTVSGGDIKIQIGKDDSQSLTIKIPAFDLASLGVDDTSIESNTNAEEAVGQLTLALQEMDQVIMTSTLPNIEDAEIMLTSIPNVLLEDYGIYGFMLDDILAATNGTNSDQNRNNYETIFDYYKSALNKLQTYVSLDGPKMLGGGDITIQIGPIATDATTLTIPVPTTDVKVVGMDQWHLTTQASSYAALDAMLKNLHDFAYSQASK